MRNKNLYGWIFTFNPYTQTWSAATRDNYFKLFSGKATPKEVLRSSDINTLIEIINKTAGNVEEINKLVDIMENSPKLKKLKK